MVTANKFKFKSNDSRITIPANSYINAQSFKDNTNGSFYLPSTTWFECLDVNINTILEFSLTSGTHSLSEFTSFINQEASTKYVWNSATIYQVRSNAWISALDFQYPIGSFILMPYNISPTSLYGGNWVKLTDYDGRYMSDCNSTALSKGGNNNVTFTPSLTCSAVTLTSSMAVASPTCNPTFSISNNVYTHSHHPYNYTSMSETVYNNPGGGTTTYYGSWNIHIASGDSYITARSVSSGSSNAWFLTAKDNGYGAQSAYLGANVAQRNNSHVHSIPNIAAANAAASHTHNVTNNTITVSVTPSSQPVVLWQRIS